MTGEATGSSRPLNSLLEQHIDLPFSKLAARRAEKQWEDGGNNKESCRKLDCLVVVMDDSGYHLQFEFYIGEHDYEIWRLGIHFL